MSPVPAGLGGGQATRISNQVANAAKAGMGNNIAAINAITPPSGGKHVAPKSQVGSYQAPPPAPANLLPPTPPQGMPPPNVAPSAQQAPPPAVDPIEKYNQDQSLDQVISSPEMMDTVTRLKLRNFYKGRSDDGIGMEAVQLLHGTSSPQG